MPTLRLKVVSLRLVRALRLHLVRRDRLKVEVIATDLVDPRNFFFGNRRRASGGLFALGQPPLVAQLALSAVQISIRRKKRHATLGARRGRTEAVPSLQPASGARGRRCGLDDDAPPPIVRAADRWAPTGSPGASRSVVSIEQACAAGPVAVQLDVRSKEATTAPSMTCGRGAVGGEMSRTER